MASLLAASALPTFLPALERQCWIGTEGDEADLAGVLRYVSEDRVVWASDDPHFDCKLLVEELLWKNTVALYNL